MQRLSREETIEMSKQNRIKPSWQRGPGELVRITTTNCREARNTVYPIRKLVPFEVQKNTWNVKNQSWQM